MCHAVPGSCTMGGRAPQVMDHEAQGGKPERKVTGDEGEDIAVGADGRIPQAVGEFGKTNQSAHLLHLVAAAPRRGDDRENVGSPRSLNPAAVPRAKDSFRGAMRRDRGLAQNGTENAAGVVIPAGAVGTVGSKQVPRLAAYPCAAASFQILRARS